ncbi:hypothetical protein Goklo_004494 [Gossypium klotzschianum]|uniref:Uncharacterized protein n=1 Tax=Gossypium klotzschianum TaxID=34286 RepID=A0A7J8VP29_9ROSI|nr:hypothetical protein [Gossypium klotzschianum]
MLLATRTCFLSRGTRRLKIFPQCMLQWMKMSHFPSLLDMALVSSLSTLGVLKA